MKRARLTEDVLEMYVLALQRVCDTLKLGVTLASKTVGRAVGQKESMEELARVMTHWKEVWDFAKVRSKEEIVLLVATDEKARDWVYVSVTSNVLGESLGVAKRLRLVVHDAGRRQWLLQRLAGNVDVLVRGVMARASGAEPPVCEFADLSLIHI